MTIQQKNIAQSLHLFTISSLCSLTAIPAGSIHYAAGAAVFTLGMACNAIAAMLLVKTGGNQKELSLKAQFASAASATVIGAVSMAGSAFFAIRDIVTEASVSFTSMGTGFAMATGMICFYGGLRGLAKNEERAAAPTASGP